MGSDVQAAPPTERTATPAPKCARVYSQKSGNLAFNKLHLLARPRRPPEYSSHCGSVRHRFGSEYSDRASSQPRRLCHRGCGAMCRRTGRRHQATYQLHPSACVAFGHGFFYRLLPLWLWLQLGQTAHLNRFSYLIGRPSLSGGSPFQGENAGSIPAGDASKINEL
jgi:hypothetical protein